MVPWDTRGGRAKGPGPESGHRGLRVSREGQVQQNQLSGPLNARAGRQ